MKVNRTAIFKDSLFVFIALLMMACEGEDSPVSSSKETVIVYMAADNDLSNEAIHNINEMEQALADGNKNLIVYMDLDDGEPRVMKISYDESEKITSSTVLNYPDQNSASPTVFRAVIDDIVGLYPSENYGLILWSHGTGWLPSTATLTTKSFGNDKGSEMDIRDLAQALPSGTFEYILFDACLMGSIEVAYQLRTKAKYILASPTEILSSGFPYKEIVSPLFDLNSNTLDKLKKVAEEYMDYYRAQSGKYQSASISLIQTDALEPLARNTRSLLLKHELSPWDYRHDAIQRLDVWKQVVTYDFQDFLSKNYPDMDVEAVQKKLENAVLYKAHTDEFIGAYSIQNFCGLSCYVPQAGRETLNAYYQTLSWCKDSGFEALFVH